MAENILNRDFVATNARSKYVSDITYLHTKEGFLYLSVVLDLFDRKIVGWIISDGMSTQETVLPALRNALAHRAVSDSLIFHSDRAVQYACKATVNYLNSYKFVQSMSRKENCWDNAGAESFFKSLKTELIYGNKAISKQQMRTNVFEYIEIWYNKKRRHSYLNYLTIDEFEKIQENKRYNINPAA